MVEEGLVGEGLADIDDRGQGFVVDLDEVEGVLGGVAAVGNDDGDGLANIADLVAGHGVLEEALDAGEGG